MAAATETPQGSRFSGHVPVLHGSPFDQKSLAGPLNFTCSSGLNEARLYRIHVRQSTVIQLLWTDAMRSLAS